MPPVPSTPQTEVALAGMRFHVCVGILPHEQELPQPLDVDIAVRHAAEAQLVDYRNLYELTRQAVESHPITYLEPLAEELARSALAIDGVTWCRVTVRKPHVALPGPLAFAQVSLERFRA